MKAMILAAGRGERMGELTANQPKPLLKVAGVSLIERHLQQLKRQGFEDIVINLAYRGEQIKSALGNGQQYGVSIEYSQEGERGLETAGGIIKALPLLGEGSFLVVNADVYSDIAMADLPLLKDHLAHLVMVKNPPHHADGDFVLSNGELSVGEKQALTYSGIGVYRPELFTGLSVKRLPLAPLLRTAMAQQQVSGSQHLGYWFDVGTPERLAHVERFIRSR